MTTMTGMIEGVEPGNIMPSVGDFPSKRSWFETPIAEIMLPDPATVEVNDNLRTVQAKINRAGVGHLPVLEHGRPVGMVTARDLARSMLVPLTVLTKHEIEILLDSPVRWVMSTPLVTLPPCAPVQVALQMMVDLDLGSVVVIDLKEDRILGIVTRSAILKLVAATS
jgi:CBS domain-containing protein